MNTEILGVVFMFGLTLLLAIPFGRYIANVYKGEKSLLDFFAPLEKLFFRISGLVCHVCTDGTGMATYEPGWQSFHDTGPGFQYSDQFHGQLQSSALFR